MVLKRTLGGNSEKVISTLDTRHISEGINMFCIDTTCRAAPELGFRTVLISDAHTTMDNDYLSASDIIAHHNNTLAGPFVTLSTARDWLFSTMS